MLPSMDLKRTDPLDDKMPSKKKQPQIPLPTSWDKYVKSGILHVFALAQYALIYSRSWAADSSNQRVRLKVERDRWEQEAPSFSKRCESRMSGWHS